MTVRTTTPFAVASISKTFLAALVVQLSLEGRFALDDPVLAYLPTANVDPAVTIRELLDHTSGVYDFFSNSKIDKALLGCPTCLWTPARALAYVKKPYFAPGTSFAYSNTNYVLLGQLVERVTGVPYATLLRQRFFGPLGLTSTYVQGMEPARGGAIAHAYRFLTSKVNERPTPLWDGTGIAPFRSLVTAAGSSGAIASSSLDLARWTRALYGGQVLGPVGAAEMLDFTTVTTDPAKPDRRATGDVRPGRGGLHDRRAGRRRPWRTAARGSGGDPLPAGRGHRDRGGHEHRPRRSGRDRLFAHRGIAAAAPAAAADSRAQPESQPESGRLTAGPIP